MLPNEDVEKDDHEQKLKVGYVLPNTNLKKDCHEQTFKKMNITSSTFQNKARVRADNKTHYSSKGCENDPNVANTSAQKIADSTKKNNSGNPAKDFDKIHKCPHCQPAKKDRQKVVQFEKAHF